jgi:small subunit ribosomal protein S7e
MASLMIKSPNTAGPTDFENKVANELYNLAMNANEIKAALTKLHITGAKEVDLASGKKAIVIYVPFKLLSSFQKIQQKVVRELEKKFSGQHVMIIAQRNILGLSYNRKTQSKSPRPRSRTLTKVQDAILDDLTFPTQILGKRTRCKVDGSKVQKIFLDPKDQVNVEAKLDTFASVYAKLTSKNVTFTF